jgi:hypothetical protein
MQRNASTRILRGRRKLLTPGTAALLSAPVKPKVEVTASITFKMTKKHTLSFSTHAFVRTKFERSMKKAVTDTAWIRIKITAGHMPQITVSSLCLGHYLVAL